MEQSLLTTSLPSPTPAPPSFCKASVAAETSVFLKESPACQDIPVCVILAAESHWISPAQDTNILPGRGIRRQWWERNPLQDRYQQLGSCGCPQAGSQTRSVPSTSKLGWKSELPHRIISKRSTQSPASGTLRATRLPLGDSLVSRDPPSPIPQ